MYIENSFSKQTKDGSSSSLQKSGIWRALHIFGCFLLDFYAYIKCPFKGWTTRQEKEIRGIQTEKEEVKPRVFADDMIPKTSSESC